MLTGMKESVDAGQKAGCINLAKDNQVRLDPNKTDLDRQAYWPAMSGIPSMTLGIVQTENQYFALY